MAHKKAGGSVAKNRDSHGKRLGVKIYGGQKASPVISLSDSEAQNSSRAWELCLAATTQFFL